MTEARDITGEGTFLVEGSVLFNLDSKVKGRFGPSSAERYDPMSGSSEIAYWGADNLRPQQVIEEVRKSDLLRPLIHKHARRLMGRGIAYGILELDERGEERPKPLRVPEIDMALKRTAANLFLYESLVDYGMHGNEFAELQTDIYGNVVGLFNQDAARCRLTRKNEKTGRIEHCVISGRWAQGAAADAKGNLKLPCLDPYYDIAGQIKASKSSRFILPLRVLHEDNDYYADGHWHALMDGGYLELAQAIIKTKLYLTINLAHIKYHVEIGSEFWPAYEPEWAKKTRDEKRKIKEDVRQQFTDWITGQEKSGRTLITDMVLDELGPAGKREYRSLWKINAFKLDIPTGAYVEDSAEVDAKIIRAFTDPSLFGQTPSKDRNSSGSGSDKRVAHSIEVEDNSAEMELLLTPFDVMADTNDWHRKHGQGQMLRFWCKTHSPATLDKTLGGVTKTNA